MLDYDLFCGCVVGVLIVFLFFISSRSRLTGCIGELCLDFCSSGLVIIVYLRVRRGYHCIAESEEGLSLYC